MKRINEDYYGYSDGEVERFNSFVSRLEAIAEEYGIVVESVGHVTIYETAPLRRVKYDRDITSGDLIAVRVQE